jgi:predicted methyltransferase
MLRVTDLARLLVQSRVQPGMTVIDATVGNGHDTVMLADAVGPTGHVYGFDIQVDALANARTRLGARTHVTLHQIGHEHMASLLPTTTHGHIAAILFNLGYLPGASKAVTTQPDTTLTALAASLTLLMRGGIVSAVLYPGHAAAHQQG